MKPVRSQNQSIGFKVLSGILGLGAALASAFCVFGLIRLGLFSKPISILIGVVIALLMVILIAMQFGLTTSRSSKIGISLLTLVVTLVMGGSSLFFFQEANALPWSFSSSNQGNDFQAESLHSTSLSFSNTLGKDSMNSIQEQLEDGMTNLGDENPTFTPPLINPDSSVSNPLDQESTNANSSTSINEVIVDTPLYIPDGDDSIYVDEPLYVPPESDPSSNQDSTTTESSF